MRILRRFPFHNAEVFLVTAVTGLLSPSPGLRVSGYCAMATTTAPLTSLAGHLGSVQSSLKDEDRLLSMSVRIGGEELLILMVADGHGGQTAADLCVAGATGHIVRASEDDPSAPSLRNACARTFECLNADVLAAGGTSGACFTVAIVNYARSEVTVAHVGDCAVVLVEHMREGVLTEEHRLEGSDAERERVSRAGAKIGRSVDSTGRAKGPVRAWPGGLAVCRTIGDSDCPCASAVPAMRTSRFDALAGAALVVASDGVWDAVSREHVGALVRQSKTARGAAVSVVKAALKKRGLRDDTTCIVSWLGLPPWASTDDSISAATTEACGSTIGVTHNMVGLTPRAHSSASEPSGDLASRLDCLDISLASSSFTEATDSSSSLSALETKSSRRRNRFSWLRAQRASNESTSSADPLDTSE